MSLEFAIFLTKNRRFDWKIITNLPWRCGSVRFWRFRRFRRYYAHP
ncbi:hypothetical protein LOK49_LG10G01061 [Camellia lanceoleosa]|uniref:Uncharacterized protein n=1 Tax=Camellia lanceoleosa TaxID=1840588 RepID=A0ACC0GFQ3_9ERIC|nr:hypothetical protein LOK49_LG10G01061 [Camellia lanceoleosa]